MVVSCLGVLLVVLHLDNGVIVVADSKLGGSECSGVNKYEITAYYIISKLSQTNSQWLVLNGVHISSKQICSVKSQSI